MSQFEFLIIGDWFDDMLISRETRQPFFNKDDRFQITETTFALGTVNPTGDSYTTRVVLPTVKTPHNMKLLLYVITHELLHSAIIDLEDWYVSAQFDSSTWVYRQSIYFNEHMGGLGYERRFEMRFHKVRKFICWLIGHDWITPMYKSNVEQFCNRCYTWEEL